MGSSPVIIIPDAPPVTITPDAAPAPRTWTDSASDFASSLWKQINPVSGIQGTAQLVDHPIDSLKSDANARKDIYDAAESEFKKGNYTAGAAHLLNAAVPFLGPQLDAAGNDFAQGNYAKGAGASVGMGLNLAGPEAMKGANISLPGAGGAEDLSKKMYQSALKPPPRTFSEPQVSSMVDTGLENGIPISQAGRTKLYGLVSDLNDKVKAQIAGGTQPVAVDPADLKANASNAGVTYVGVQKMYGAGSDKLLFQPTPGGTTLAVDADKATPENIKARIAGQPIATTMPATVNKFDVASRLKATANKFATQVNPEADLDAVSDSGNEFLRNQPNDIPVTTAQDLKSGTYQQLGDKAYGELKSASIEAQKSLAKGIKEELQNQFPEIQGMNQKESQLLGLDDALEGAVNRTRNRDIFGLGGKVLSGAGAAAGAGAGGGLGAAIGTVPGILYETVSNPVVQSKLAIALNRASKGTITIGAAQARIGSYLNALGNAAAHPSAPSIGADNPASSVDQGNQQ